MKKRTLTFKLILNKEPYQHIVMFSGGVGSWMAAKRVAEQYGTKNLTLLFANTLIEDPDLYRFLEEAAINIGGQFVKLQEGRTPWQIFKDVKYLGNSRIDPCSKILKRELLRTYIEKEFSSKRVTIYLGYDWTEIHRLDKAQKYWSPWTVEAPMCNPPYLEKGQMIQELTKEGIKPPLLYELGFPHNNCGGGCIKAGQAHFAHLLKTLPEVYCQWEKNEQEIQRFLQKNVTILRDRSKGTVTPLSLREFREKVQKDCFDHEEWGGCGCFSEYEE